MEQILQKPKILPAYKVLRGKDYQGKPLLLRIDTFLQKLFDRAIYRNKKKNWDYVSIVAGYCGVGKSIFSQTIARYCDETFDETRVCFTAEEFIKVTNEVPEFSAVILDESFQSLNTRVTMSPDFMKIINHLNIIRQKHLFIFLCLPNFFDLAKNVAIFRTNHLFVCYSDDDGNRGKVLVFGKSEKNSLYILGGKLLDYNRVYANKRCSFWKNDVIDEQYYEQMKIVHLKSQEVERVVPKAVFSRANLVSLLRWKLNFSYQEIADASGVSFRTIKNSVGDVTINHKKTGVTSS